MNKNYETLQKIDKLQTTMRDTFLTTVDTNDMSLASVLLRNFFSGDIYTACVNIITTYSGSGYWDNRIKPKNL